MAGKKKAAGLASAMSKAAGKVKPEPEKKTAEPAAEQPTAAPQFTMIGGRFRVEQRRALKQAEINANKTFGALLEEALKDVCFKYGVIWPTVE